MADEDAQIDPEREKEGMMLMHRMEDAILQSTPNDAERCKDCKWFLGFSDIGYCWHQKIRMLVGPEWWCQWWETEKEADEMKAYQDTANPEPGRVG
jgi:hypothetical protein